MQSADDTNETVLSEARECTSVKNEPQDFNEDDDLLSHSLETSDNIKSDLHGDDNSNERSFGPSDSVTISRSQAAMQQLQESFGSFLPGMGQSPGSFLSHGASDMPRPPPFPMEGVQGKITRETLFSFILRKISLLGGIFDFFFIFSRNQLMKIF